MPKRSFMPRVHISILEVQYNHINYNQKPDDHTRVAEFCGKYMEGGGQSWTGAILDTGGQLSVYLNFIKNIYQCLIKYYPI